MLITGHQEKEAEYYNDIYGRGYDTSGYMPLYNLIAAALDTVYRPRVLELGCGLGDLGDLIIQRGFPYRGFDFSETAIEQSRQRFPKGDFRVGDVYNPDDYRPVDYNTIVALEVLEHVDDVKVMENIPPGVHIIASVPDYNDAAHLRLYQDPKRDIVGRYSPYIHTIDVRGIIFKNAATGMNQTIYIFHGIRLVSQ